MSNDTDALALSGDATAAEIPVPADAAAELRAPVASTAPDMWHAFMQRHLRLGCAAPGHAP